MRRAVSGVLLWAVVASGVPAAAEQAKPGTPPPTRAPATKKDASGAARDAEKLSEAGRAGHAGLDPNHPLKDPTVDPGPNPGQVPEDERRYDGSPDILYAEGNWPWGELHYGKTYSTTLTITNECWAPETVGVFVHNLPYITLPPSVTVPAKGKLEIPISIVTPPEPKLVLTGREEIPEHGIFGTVEGELVLWHPWRFDPECKPKRESYKATGHIHYDLTPPAAPPSPEQIAGATPCEVWWQTGQRPEGATEEDCTEPMRGLASNYRTRVLQPVADRAPAAWTWLPSAEGIAGMSIADLLAMKARAQAQLEKQP